MADKNRGIFFFVSKVVFPLYFRLPETHTSTHTHRHTDTQINTHKRSQEHKHTYTQTYKPHTDTQMKTQKRTHAQTLTQTHIDCTSQQLHCCVDGFCMLALSRRCPFGCGCAFSESNDSAILLQIISTSFSNTAFTLMFSFADVSKNSRPAKAFNKNNIFDRKSNIKKTVANTLTVLHRFFLPL